MAELSKSGQSSFSAIVGAVACITLLAVSLGWLYSGFSAVSERHRQDMLQNLAVVLSNDLLLNPGYTEDGLGWTIGDFGKGGPGRDGGSGTHGGAEEGAVHIGLARYDFGTKNVDEHVLDMGKVGELKKVLECCPERLGMEWNIENRFWVVVEDLDSGRVLLEHTPAVNYTRRISVSRLAVLEGRHAKLTLVLFE